MKIFKRQGQIHAPSPLKGYVVGVRSGKKEIPPIEMILAGGNAIAVLIERIGAASW